MLYLLLLVLIIVLLYYSQDKPKVWLEVLLSYIDKQNTWKDYPTLFHRLKVLKCIEENKKMVPISKRSLIGDSFLNDHIDNTNESRLRLYYDLGNVHHWSAKEIDTLVFVRTGNSALI